MDTFSYVHVKKNIVTDVEKKPVLAPLGDFGKVTIQYLSGSLSSAIARYSEKQTVISKTK